MFKYWLRVVVRAWMVTKLTLGHNRAKSIVTTVGTLIAFAIFGLIEGGPSAWQKIEWWLSCIGGAALLFLLVFGYHFLRAPYDMEIEMNKRQTNDQGGKVGDSASGYVDSLIAPENYIQALLNNSMGYLAKTAKSGDRENSLRFAKEDAEYNFPAAIESLWGKKETKDYLSVLESQKAKTPDDWMVLYNVASNYLQGIVIKKRSKKLSDMLDGFREWIAKTTTENK